jgi:hypothetical protein
MILKISIMHVTMTGYRIVRKPALNAPEPLELEFVRDTFCRVGRAMFARGFGQLSDVAGTKSRNRNPRDTIIGMLFNGRRCASESSRPSCGTIYGVAVSSGP